MRYALIRLAPLAVFLSVFASAQTKVAEPVQSGTVPTTPVSGVGGSVPSSLGGGVVPGASLKNVLGGVSGAPVFNAPAAPAAASAQDGALSVASPMADPAAHSVSVPASPVAISQTQPAGVLSPTSASPSAAPRATAVLGGAAREVEQSRFLEAAGGADLSVHAALARAFDASAPGRKARVDAGVAGRFAGTHEQVAKLVSEANTERPVNAAGL